MSEFETYQTGLEAPLTNGEVADYSAGNHDFTQRPRALNCSAEGTLTVDLGAGLVNEAIHVVAGLNPYRVTRVYQTGSDVMTVVGMW